MYTDKDIDRRVFINFSETDILLEGETNTKGYKRLDIR